MRITNDYVFFWGSELSNWFTSKFIIDGIKFNCSEQYMMYMKAKTFGDENIANLILKEKDPRKQKALGRKVSNFNIKIWGEVSFSIVLRARLVQHTQNQHMLDFMRQDIFRGKKFVEASPYDVIWGVGLGEDDPLIDDPNNWKGENRLGLVHDEVWRILNV